MIPQVMQWRVMAWQFHAYVGVTPTRCRGDDLKNFMVVQRHSHCDYAVTRCRGDTIWMWGRWHDHEP
jgi:hypothetical protein